MAGRTAIENDGRKRRTRGLVRALRRVSAALVLGAALVGTALVGGALAQETSAGGEVATGWSDSDVAPVRLIAGADGPMAGGALPLALEFDLAETWKVYWRSPGDAGYPPELTDQGSENLASIALEWPAPKRFSIFGLESFGYGGKAVLPLTVRIDDPDKPVTVRQKVSYLTCSDICVPFEAELALTLDGTGEPTEHTQAIGKALGKVPVPAGLFGATVESAFAPAPSTGSADTAPAITVAVAGLPLAGADVIVEGPLGVAFSKPEIRPTAQGFAARMDVQGDTGLVAADTALTVTVLSPEGAIEQSVTAGGAGTGTEESVPWLSMIGFALLGGLILNLMPCVLPVLSLKLMKVIGFGGRELREIRAGFLASSAGILSFMLALAGGLIALKSAGAVVGWGIQFQEPLLLGFMVVVLSLFAANLLGFFEFALPQKVSDGALKATGGQGLVAQYGQGAFAALLATPCSAPFVGTAVSFALGRGALEIVVIFAALGVGLAAPFLLVAAVPALAQRLPRPGPWMVKLRWVLAFALVATAVWLLSIVWVQAGVMTAVALGIGAALLLGLLALRGQVGQRRVAGVWAGAALTALVTLSLPAWVGQATPVETPAPASDALWADFDPALIQSRVKAGEVVLVDVTADWCLTCKVNKRLVLDAEAITALIGGDGVTAVRADWTNPDDRISRYLASFGRYGIPFNAVYGPAAPDGIALPELLTVEAVLDAVEQARGG
ncbi:MAG: protein-disulfide reductase DsbD family protein [Alphaproteobacteria bacterium]|nr:protein-disulfide reductase DsbD family protein [Alphaproteobacteria bacterium]